MNQTQNLFILDDPVFDKSDSRAKGSDSHPSVLNDHMVSALKQMGVTGSRPGDSINRTVADSIFCFIASIKPESWRKYCGEYLFAGLHQELTGMEATESTCEK